MYKKENDARIPFYFSKKGKELFLCSKKPAGENSSLYIYEKSETDNREGYSQGARKSKIKTTK